MDLSFCSKGAQNALNQQLTINTGNQKESKAKHGENNPFSTFER